MAAGGLVHHCESARIPHSRQRLLNDSRGADVAVGERTLDKRIVRLRRLLTDAGCTHAIVTVRGQGYCLAPVRKE